MSRVIPVLLKECVRVPSPQTQGGRLRRKSPSHMGLHVIVFLGLAPAITGTVTEISGEGVAAFPWPQNICPPISSFLSREALLLESLCSSQRGFCWQQCAAEPVPAQHCRDPTPGQQDAVSVLSSGLHLSLGRSNKTLD